MSLPKTCRAVVLEEYKKPMKVKEVRMPERIEPGAIMVKIEVASICGSDNHLWAGEMVSVIDSKLPLIPGHEMVGRIVELGEYVRQDSVGQELKVGDRILWSHAACGECNYCQVLKKPTLCTNRTLYGFAESCEKPPYVLGGFAEYCYVLPRSGKVKIPEEVKSEWASGVGCALRTVMNGFDRLNGLGGIKFTDSVLVQGAGPLGLYSTAVASKMGPEGIIVIGGPANRLEVAKQWGASKIVSVDEFPDPASRVNRVKELTGGRGVDVILEMSGAHGAFAEGLEMLAIGGKYVIVGQVGGPKTPIAAELITRKNLDIVGVWSADIEHYYKGLQFVKRYRNEINFDLMFTSRFGLEDIMTGYERMANFTDIKSVIIP